MILWIPAIGIGLCVLAACDVGPQKPKTAHSAISTGSKAELLMDREVGGIVRHALDADAESRKVGQIHPGRITGADSVRLHGPGVSRRLQTRT